MCITQFSEVMKLLIPCSDDFIIKYEGTESITQKTQGKCNSTADDNIIWT